ncbi:three-Cys-motif partner protein TcmP [Actinomadura macrotermitis]|uniref:Three-Cys-motif partner protein TcmP n=1 Tax=Actinomadura macrotermitis TaxID=2585200 RepID=A0A7K0BXJ5_9ACTN|nr:three-Cys-motif partner protein TcmP [Actinomadura macrotermitis]MQY05910.1 hypothetical protein [Actinomadura macrotermitis]
MATGTSGGLLDKRDPHAQSVFKHEILKQYMSRFIAMPGKSARDNRVVILDGFAGSGRYGDGSAGSAEHILRATRRFASTRTAVSFFTEKDRKNFASLQPVVQEYAEQGLDAQALFGPVQQHLDTVIAASDGVPLFLFLDPCGAGLPFKQLTHVLGSQRRATKPPTEALINFSADLSRRMAGAVEKGHTDQALMDETCGGTWWRDIAAEVRRNSKSPDFREVVEAVVQEYARLLGEATGMLSATVPVRKRLHHAQPIYHMVFFTRSPYGLWVFGDSVGRAKQVWLKHLGVLEDDECVDQDTLFPVAETFKSIIDGQEQEARRTVTANLQRLLEEHNSFKVVDRTTEIFGKAYGSATETIVHQCLKELQTAGKLEVLVSHKRWRERVIARPR